MKYMLKPRKRMAGSKVRPFTVYLPEELDTWIRRRAHARKMKLTEEVREAIEFWRQYASRRGATCRKSS